MEVNTTLYRLLLIFLIFVSCEKEMSQITQPQYSFIRLNEEGATIPDCFTQLADCLPVSDLDDLRFMMITDFSDGGGIHDPDFFQVSLAVPCDFCGELVAADIYDILFGDNQLIKSTSSSGGKLVVTTDFDFGAQSNVGNWVFLTGTGSYEGFHEVIAVAYAGDDNILTLDLDIDGSATVGNRVSLISDMAIVADASIDAPDDVEFVGSNYSWDYSKPMNSLSGINDAYVRPELAYVDGDCLRLCVWRLLLFANGLNMPIFQEAECLGTTNCLKKTDRLCYTTKITYGCDESAFGFYADVDPFVNSVRLPFYLSRPKYPGEESGYQRSDGTFQKLSERVNKTWLLKTDWIPEDWHERLRIALSCDNVEVTNELANLIEVPIYKQEEYVPQWNEDVDYPFAPGECVVFKKLFSRSINSNCV